METRLMKLTAPRLKRDSDGDQTDDVDHSDGGGPHLLDLPLLGVGDLGEPLALQSVVLLHLRDVAQVQVGGPVGVPHGDLLPAVGAHVPPPVGVQVLPGLLVYVLGRRNQRESLHGRKRKQRLVLLPFDRTTKSSANSSSIATI